LDIERDTRASLCNALCDSFDVFQELKVTAFSSSFRVDVVAIPKDHPFSDFAIGFEVKAPSSALNFQNWAKVYKQAADYVGTVTETERIPQRKLVAIFVYPSPPYFPFSTALDERQEGEEIWFRKDQLLQYAGVIHLAQHFRVGHARWATLGKQRVFELAMGPNPIWNQRQGWFKNGQELLFSMRSGSQMKPV
jgi:hypothetical protein